MKKIIKSALAIAMTLLPLSAFSLEFFVGKVTYLEPTYMPGVIRFTVNGGNSNCPAGKAITWANANVENNKVVYSTLMAALMADKTVRIYANDGDVSCKAQFLHLLPN